MLDNMKNNIIIYLYLIVVSVGFFEIFLLYTDVSIQKVHKISFCITRQPLISSFTNAIHRFFGCPFLLYPSILHFGFFLSDGSHPFPQYVDINLVSFLLSA